MDLHPVIFEPIFKRRIWGNRRLRQVFGKATPDDELIGESWELADLPEDKSLVARGPMAGKRVDELIREWGEQLMGPVALFDGSFPLLIKFLDAGDVLSVQVHPDPLMALRLGVRVKHEAWYVIDCEPGALIYKGLRDDVTREMFAAAVNAGTSAELLNPVPVTPGQCHYLPSGTVHALGAGIMVAEIQTPSDVTYRVFDWNRVDAVTGAPRQLHIREALESIRFGAQDAAPTTVSPDRPAGWPAGRHLLTCDSFVIDEVSLSQGRDLHRHQLAVWIILEGAARLCYDGGRQELQLARGDTALLPAQLGGARLEPHGDLSFLEVTVPASP